MRDVTEVLHLVKLAQLRVLWLGDNPCSIQTNYRQYVIHTLPQLGKLDNQGIVHALYWLQSLQHHIERVLVIADITADERQAAALAMRQLNVVPMLNMQQVLAPRVSTTSIVTPQSTRSQRNRAAADPGVEAPVVSLTERRDSTVQHRPVLIRLASSGFKQRLLNYWLTSDNGGLLCTRSAHRPKYSQQTRRSG